MKRILVSLAALLSFMPLVESSVEIIEYYEDNDENCYLDYPINKWTNKKKT